MDEIARQIRSSKRFAQFIFFCTGVWCLTSLCWGDDNSPLNPLEDVRLRQTVSAAFAPTPLGELLQKLSQQTGITLRAERTVAEHRAILVAHEKPLHETLRRLAEAFDYRWRKVEAKGKPPEYILFQPAQQQAQQAAEIEELRRLSRAMLLGIPRRLRENPVEDPVSARARLREERQQRSPRFRNRSEAINYLQEQAARNSVSSSLTWGVMQALSLLSEQDWQRLQQGEVFRFDTASPNSPLPSSVVDMARLEWAEQARYEANLGLAADEDQRRHYERMQRINRAAVSLWMDPLDGEMYYTIRLYDGEPLPAWASATVRLEVSSLLDLALQLDELLEKEEEAVSIDAPLLKRLSRQIPLQPLSLNERLDVLGTLLSRYAKANEVCLVAEWYPYLSTGAFSRTEGASLYSQPSDAQWNWLAVWSDLRSSRYQLRITGDWLVVTQRLRPLCRHYEIPERNIRRWLLMKGREGVPGLQEMVEIASLEGWQLEMLDKKVALMAPASGLQRAGEDLCASLIRERPLRFALLALGALPAHQRSALIRGAPVPIASMPRQAQRFMVWAVYALDVQTDMETNALPQIDMEPSFADADTALLVRVEEHTTA
ncbi:MAG: hypothetical protein ACP5RN_15420, partial [Armatimonadota bacterium]